MRGLFYHLNELWNSMPDNDEELDAAAATQGDLSNSEDNSLTDTDESVGTGSTGTYSTPGSPQLPLDTNMSDQDTVLSYCRILSTRYDTFLPQNRRKDWVEDLLSEPKNEDFWDHFRSRGGRDMAQEFRGEKPGLFAVAPHPCDELIWYVRQL
jgi:hypothetical protein